MSIWCKWFGIGCPKPTPPVPPTPPAAVKGIGVGLSYGGATVVGATVSLDGAGTFPLTNADGYTFMNVPNQLTASQLTITALGFNPYSTHVDLYPSGGTDLIVGGTAVPPQVQCEPLAPAHVDPSQFSLRELARIRGAMWTVRGPWRFGPRPGQPDNITAMEYIYSYGDNPRVSPFVSGLNDEQKGMLSTYKAGGYTHLAFGPTNAESYHGQYPDYSFDTPEAFDVWLDWLQLFWDNGLAPVCFLHGDGETFEQTQARVEPLIKGNPRAQKLMRIVIPTGWEPARYEWSSNTWALFCQWIGGLLPNALVGIHTVADIDAPVGTDGRGDDNGKPNGEGWSRVAPHIHMWFIQNGAYSVSPEQDPNLARNFAAQFEDNAEGAALHGARWHFNNAIAGWPNFSKWGNEPIYLINAECTSYPAYWNNLPYEVSKKWGDLAVASSAEGYLDSGNVAPPPAKG